MTLYRRCFFETEVAGLVLFHIPVALLQVSNLVFFVSTTAKLWNTWNLGSEVQLNNNNSSSKKNLRDHFSVIVKLFVFMGLTW